VLRYPSIVADYANLEVTQQVAQVTVCTAQWLGQVRSFAIDFQLTDYAYMYIIII
jgi:hypothetical protein